MEFKTLVLYIVRNEECVGVVVRHGGLMKLLKINMKLSCRLVVP